MPRYRMLPGGRRVRDTAPTMAESTYTGSAADVLAQVGDDPRQARAALAVEQGRDKPRSTLIASLRRIAGDE